MVAGIQPQPGSDQKDDMTNGRQLIAIAESDNQLYSHVRHFRLAASFSIHDHSGESYERLRSVLRAFQRTISASLYFPEREQDIAAFVVGLAMCAPLRELDVSAPIEEVTRSAALATFLSSQTYLKRLDLIVKRRSHSLEPSPPRSATKLAPAAFCLESLSVEAATITHADFDFLTHHSTTSLRKLALRSGHPMDDTLSLTRFTSLRELTLDTEHGINISSTLFGLSSLHLITFRVQYSSSIASSTLVTLLSALPPSIQLISCPQPGAADAILLLSVPFPNLVIIDFHTHSRRIEGGAGGMWTPDEQLAVTRACRANGYRLNVPEPRDYNLALSGYRVRPRRPIMRQQTLDELGWLIPPRV